MVENMGSIDGRVLVSQNVLIFARRGFLLPDII
jgi:hypothetical protein